ncbi:MAG: SPOR domain-containing protein [Pseudomonadota bacterium]
MTGVRRSSNAAILVCMGAMALAGCDELTLPGQPGASAQANAASTGQLRIEEREREAPEVFSRQDSGLWDGRPSLGGLWVATPGVQAERVRVRNTENGREITAALYGLPEDRSPGGFLVSSDAATELGMIGGQRADLDVVALRKETVEIPPVAAPQTVAALEAERLPSANAAEVETLETEALEAAPLDVNDGDAPDTAAAAVPAPSPDTTPETTAASGAAVAAAVTAILTPDPTPTSAPSAPEAQAAAASASPSADGASPPQRPSALVRGENRPQETAELTPEGTLVLPFIAVASYPERDRASAVITQLEVEGITTKGRLLTDRNGTRYAVLAGPAASVEERDALLAKIKALGFDGAFASR